MEIEEVAKNLIKGEMKKNNIKTKDICRLLKEKFNIDIEITSFNNKMSRGTFTANFLFQCLYVLESKNIYFDTSKVSTDNN